MKTVYPFKNRAVLVTGAGTGIGRATAELLAQKGAFVGIHYNSSKTAAEEALAAVKEKGGNGILLKADISIENEANTLVDEFVAAAGKLDVLINNAGSPVERSSIENCSLSLWEKVIAINLTGTFLVIRRAIPYLRKSEHAAIVNNLSLSVQTGGANGGGPYAAAKGGVQVLTRTLAKELAPKIRVNAVMPGVIETRHHEMFSSPERMEQYRKETPLGRNGTAAEVASVIVFLASDDASFLTGALVDINGGRFLR